MMALLMALTLSLSACGERDGETLFPHSHAGAPTDTTVGTSAGSTTDTSVVIKGLEADPSPAQSSGTPESPASPDDTIADAILPVGEQAGELSQSSAQSGMATPTALPDAPSDGETAGSFALPARGVITSSSLNLRAAANEQSMVVGSLAQGDSFTALSQAGDWYYVDCKLGEGYLAAQYTRLDGEGLKPQREALRFYDDVAGQFVTVEKEFYMASWQGQPRRFDAKLSPADFGWEGDMAVVHPELQEMAQRMARSLYQTEGARVTCYFGQYYPSATGEDGSVHQTGIHEGIDFAGPDMYAPFYALADGVVTSVQDGEDRDQYNWIAVKTGDVTVFYIHHYQSSVSVGDTVAKGDKLGLQGDNGARGAYHVHLEVVQGDAASFNRSKDTVLVDDPPYDFWRSQGY